MSDYDHEPDRDYGRGPDMKRNILIGVAAAGAVIVWLVFASPGDEAPSTRGFNMGSTSGAPSSGRAFQSRPKTSLDMVSARIGDGPAGVTPGLLPGSQETAPEAPAEENTGEAPKEASEAAANPAAPPAPAQKESPADEAKTLAGAGIPTDARGLDNLGAKPGMLSSLASKLLNHPKVLAAIFNNKTVVNAFMNRPIVKENCENGGSLKAYLSDPNSGGMTKVFPVIQKALSNPSNSSALVSALSGTEMASRLGACPSVKQLGSDPSAVTTIAMGNPKALTLLMDPRGMAAVASNPQAAGALAGLQAKMGGGK